ncbi:hypothetical protein D9M72_558120 [compost metagenome]
MARHDHGDRVVGDRSRYIPRITRTDLGRERPIIRGLASRNFPQHEPDLDLIRRPTQIEWQIANLGRIVDRAGHGFDHVGKFVLGAFKLGFRKSDTQRILHRGAHRAEFKHHNPFVRHGDNKVAEGTGAPCKSNSFTHRLTFFIRCETSLEADALRHSPVLAFKSKCWSSASRPV